MSDITLGSQPSSDEVTVIVNTEASITEINTAKNDTLTYRNETLTAKDNAIIAQTGAETAETNANTYKIDAATYSSSASTSASSASTSASTATTQAGIATTQAGIATTQATNSSSYADTALSNATAASGSASAANISATNAAISEANAAISESNAADSASQAAVSRIATDNKYAAFASIWLGKFITADMPTVGIDVGSMAYDTTLNSFRTWNGLVWSEATKGDSISSVTSSKVGKTTTVEVYVAGLLADTFTVEDGIDSAVLSVAGRTGNVVVSKTDVGLSNVDNTTDANKPISTATQTALDNKLNTTDIGVSVEAYDATILKSADIGVNVEAYDATILKSADIGATVQGYSSLLDPTVVEW